MALDDKQIVDTLEKVGVGNRVAFDRLMSSTPGSRMADFTAGILRAYSLESRTMQVEVDAYVEGLRGETIRTGTKVNTYDFDKIDQFYVEGAKGDDFGVLKF